MSWICWVLAMSWRSWICSAYVLDVSRILDVSWICPGYAVIIVIIVIIIVIIVIIMIIIIAVASDCNGSVMCNG